MKNQNNIYRTNASSTQNLWTSGGKRWTFDGNLKEIHVQAREHRKKIYGEGMETHMNILRHPGKKMDNRGKVNGESIEFQ